MPKGDWLWPAIWLLPTDLKFGTWPASGEIDLMESRGNPSSCKSGVDSFGSTLHYGPKWPFDAWETGSKEYTHTSDLSDDFHVYKLEWTKEHIKTFIDDTLVLNFDFDEDLFKKGKFPNDVENPWGKDPERNIAPFNQEFHFIFNVAVGGTNGYFQDD